MKLSNRLLFFLIYVAILVLNLEKEHEERQWLTYHLRTKVKYMVLKNEGTTQTLEKFLQL
jgi:hypothetical protein